MALKVETSLKDFLHEAFHLPTVYIDDGSSFLNWRGLLKAFTGRGHPLQALGRLAPSTPSLTGSPSPSQKLRLEIRHTTTNGEGGWLHLIGIVSLRHCY